MECPVVQDVQQEVIMVMAPNIPIAVWLFGDYLLIAETVWM